MVGQLVYDDQQPGSNESVLSNVHTFVSQTRFFSRPDIAVKNTEILTLRELG